MTKRVFVIEKMGLRSSVESVFPEEWLIPSTPALIGSNQNGALQLYNSRAWCIDRLFCLRSQRSKNQNQVGEKRIGLPLMPVS